VITVLHTESSTGWGGQENRTLRECIGIRDLGARPVILCQPGSVIGQRARSEGIDVKTVPMQKSYDLGAVRSIQRAIRDEQVDVVSTHSGRDSLLAGTAAKLSRRRPRVVRTRHLALPISSRLSYSLFPHRIVTVSEFVRRDLIARGLPPEKIVAVHTGIDPAVFDPAPVRGPLRQELGCPGDTPIVVTNAIFRIKKGHHILLEAIPFVLKKIPEALFVFTGNGPQRVNIEQRISTMGLSGKVVLTGLRQDIPEVLKSSDLFVLPTLQEALGTAIIEAMAMERPVIGSNVGGVGELIRDGVNGFLVEPRNPLTLAEAIVRVLGDRDLALSMGREGRRIVLQNFTVRHMCEKMYGLYVSLLGGKA